MRAVPALLLALITMMAITPAFGTGVDQNRLERTVLPEHFGALPFAPWPLEPVPPFRATPIRPERVVYRLKGSIREVAKVDRDLSTACRPGTFIQRLDFIFRVRSADDRPYGIGWGPASTCTIRKNAASSTKSICSTGRIPGCARSGWPNWRI
jgi:hypothetical protein